MVYMLCNEIVERVTDHFEDALGPEDRQRWDSHLAVCPGCQAHVGQVRVTVGLAAAQEPEVLPDALLARALAAFRARTMSSSR